MATVSSKPAAGAFASGDLFYIVQPGGGRSTTLGALATYFGSGGGGVTAVADGGTGQTTYTNGQLLIGNTTGNTLTKATLTAGAGITITNGAGSITIAATALVVSVAALTIGTSGTNITSTVANGTTTPVITLNVPTASASNRGALSSADWSTFNAKQAAISFGANVLTFIGTPTFANLVAAVTGDTLVGRASVDTLTNKRVTSRVSTAASPASPLAPNSDTFDQYSITGLTGALTINADAGAPTSGQKIIYRIKDSGAPRALTWTTGASKSFRPVGVTLPTTTVAGKIMYVGCIFNSTDDRWDVVAVSVEA
jgi:hypothetical protein